MLPNARVLIHQPHGGAQGQVDRHRARGAGDGARCGAHGDELLAEHRPDVERIAADIDRDFILAAEDAVAYGLVDDVLSRRSLAPYPAADGAPRPSSNGHAAEATTPS